MPLVEKQGLDPIKANAKTILNFKFVEKHIVLEQSDHKVDDFE
jgi:hypothetical protein